MKKREITLQTGEFPAEDSESTILLFDGVCHFCHAAVHFIIRRDPEARVRFASMQSEVGKRLLKKRGLTRPVYRRSCCTITAVSMSNRMRY